MSIYVEFDPLGKDPFVLKMAESNIRHVRQAFKESGAIIGTNEKSEEIYVLDNLLITYREVNQPSSWGKAKPGPKPKPEAKNKK